MPLLEVHELCSHYGDLQALFDLSLSIDEGQATALIGANGAGKSTLIQAIAGLGARSRGRVHFAGEAIHMLPAERIAARGIALRLYQRIRDGHDWGARFEPEPAEPILERMAELAPREMRRAWMTAFGNARLDGRRAIELRDLPSPSSKRPPIGFQH